MLIRKINNLILVIILLLSNLEGLCINTVQVDSKILERQFKTKRKLIDSIDFDSSINLNSGPVDLNLEVKLNKEVKMLAAKFVQPKAKKDPKKKTDAIKVKNPTSTINGVSLYSLTVPFTADKELGEWFLKLKLKNKNGKKLIIKNKDFKKLGINNTLQVVNEAITTTVQEETNTNNETQEEEEEEEENNNQNQGNNNGGGNSNPNPVEPDPPPPPPDPDPETDPPESIIVPPRMVIDSGSPVDDISFIYNGDDAVQVGLDPAIIDDSRQAIIRGKVFNTNHDPLPGVKVTIHKYNEFGHTLSLSNGEYDLVVNGGKRYTVRFTMPGYLTVQRTVVTTTREFFVLEDVVMTKLDTAMTDIELNDGQMQVAKSSICQDEDGERQATILVPPSTVATMVLENGSTVELESCSIRATEYTIGNNGRMAMPGTLPPTSSYTYAIELSVDEAIAAGAIDVKFNQPLPFYVDNFLDLPVGAIMPLGYYSKIKDAWIPDINGRVIKIIDIAEGSAVLDIDGSGIAASAEQLQNLKITSQELVKLAQEFEVDQSFWRALIPHFSPWDLNLPGGPPPDSEPPPPDPPTNDDDNQPDDPCKQGGSIIGCESQSLKEVVPITGTSLSLVYDSTRVQGRSTGRFLSIRLAGPSVPPSLKKVEVIVQVAGRVYKQEFNSVAPNQKMVFEWDGKDAFGREFTGSVMAHVDVKYHYQLFLYDAREDLVRSFAQMNTDLNTSLERIVGTRENQTSILSRKFQKMLHNHALEKRLGLGGWSLSRHHYYNPDSRTLFKGDGGVVANSFSEDIIDTIPGGNIRESAPFFIGFINDIDVDSEGNSYIIDSWNNHINKITPDGDFVRVAGIAFGGDPITEGAPALNTKMLLPKSVAIGPDGSLFYSEWFGYKGKRYNRIRKVTPDAKVYTVAGIGKDGGPTYVGGFSGDGGPAIEAELKFPNKIAVDKEGSVYIADNGNNRIRKVSPDGIISTVVGDGTITHKEGDLPATGQGIFGPEGVAIGPDGSLYLVDFYRAYKVTPDGIIKTIAGQGRAGSTGDGGPAVDARLNFPEDIDVDRLGNVYIAEREKIRVINQEGIINALAGDGTRGYEGDGGPPGKSKFYGINAVHVTPDGGVVVIDNVNGRLRKINPSLPGFTGKEITIPDKSGRAIYLFGKKGRHKGTVNALTGKTMLRFAYDNGGMLNTITDANSDMVTIERDGKDIQAIISPDGLRTEMTVNDNGYITSITNPAGETYSMTYDGTGLLSSFTNPRGYTSTMTYGTRGKLKKDVNAIGGSWTLERNNQIKSGDYKVVMESALGRKIVHHISTDNGGNLIRRVTKHDDRTNIQTKRKDGTVKLERSDGTVIETEFGPDPRFLMLAPYVSKRTIETPDGLLKTITKTRTAKLVKGNIANLDLLTTDTTINNRTYISVFNGDTSTFTITSPEGRSSSRVIDRNGQTIESSIPGLATISYEYDTRGRVIKSTRDPGLDERITTYTYNTDGFLDTIVDPVGDTVRFTYDSIGRATSVSLNNNEVSYQYDTNSNVTGITPPGKEEHGHDYTEIDQLSEYSPPAATGTGFNDTSYSYDLDRSLIQVDKPDGSEINLVYGDKTGRLKTMTSPEGTMTYEYFSKSGKVKKIETALGEIIKYEYDGFLRTKEEWDGTMDATVTRQYNKNFNIKSRKINNANKIEFSYDNDRLLTQAGDLRIINNGSNVLIMGTNLDDLSTNLVYNSFAEPINRSVSYAGGEIYSATYARDDTGRVVNKSEVISGVFSSYEYKYDNQKRLSEVYVNGTLSNKYEYDANGNRVRLNGADIATYDEQDRLITYGNNRYQYTPNGDLSSKTNVDSGNVTNYAYDTYGNLVEAQLPGGQTISYVIDARNRRIGKKVDGVLVQGLIYKDTLNPIAELDGVGDLVSRFVYATKTNVPDYMIRAGNKYKIVSDNHGSVRFVVDVSSGSVVQRMDYDEFGNVMLDTNPGFQPFGFAGGIYDKDTGLVKFGARDYDPEVGRWIEKDPIRFNSGQVNLYVYVNNDPINFIDPSGLFSFPTVLGFTAGGAVNGAFIGARAGGVGAGIGAAVGAVAGFAGGIVSQINGGGPLQTALGAAVAASPGGRVAAGVSAAAAAAAPFISDVLSTSPIGTGAVTGGVPGLVQEGVREGAESVGDLVQDVFDGTPQEELGTGNLESDNDSDPNDIPGADSLLTEPCG